MSFETSHDFLAKRLAQLALTSVALAECYNNCSLLVPLDGVELSRDRHLRRTGATSVVAAVGRGRFQGMGLDYYH
jgi:hypothetical protein